MCPNTLTDNTSWEMIIQCFHNAPWFAQNWSGFRIVLCAVHFALFLIILSIFMMRAQQDETTHLKLGWVVGRRMRNPVRRYFIDYRWWVSVSSLIIVGIYWLLIVSYFWRPKQLFDVLDIGNSIWGLSPQGVDFVYQILRVISISGIFLAFIQLMTVWVLALDPYGFTKFKIYPMSDNKNARVFVRPRRYHGLPPPGKVDKEISPFEPIEFYQQTIYIGRNNDEVIVNLNSDITADLNARADDLHWVKLTIKETYQNRIIPKQIFPIRKYQLEGSINSHSDDPLVFVTRGNPTDTVAKGQFFIVHDCRFRFY